MAKLLKVAPNLKEDFGVPLRDQIKPRDPIELDRMGSSGFIQWEEEIARMNSNISNISDKANSGQVQMNTNFSSDKGNIVVIKGR